jgi:hypothetical protein
MSSTNLLHSRSFQKDDNPSGDIVKNKTYESGSVQYKRFQLILLSKVTRKIVRRPLFKLDTTVMNIRDPYLADLS